MSTTGNAVDELFAYFGSFVNFEQRQRQTIREYRLDRMQQLLEFFGNPHRSLKIIHIAGSKGKGSTAIYLARGLDALGFKTGLYSSPHIADYRERITLAGRYFEDQLYMKVGTRIQAALPEFTHTVLAGEADPTAFELFTLYAFLLFAEADCSYAVIETGIGGRLDATNVVSPQASVLTSIELEHTDILGNSLEQIAAEKAGIIKPGAPVFVSRQPENVLEVFRRHAARAESRLYYFPDYPAAFSATVDGAGTHLYLQWRGPAEPVIQLDLAMQGEVQAENAGLALTVLRELSPERVASSYENMLHAVAAAILPGRMELCSTEPPVVLDGAHTPASVRRTVATFQRIYGTGGICIFGSVEGKDTAGMAAAVSAAFSDIIISRPGTFKPNSPQEVARIFHEVAPQAELQSDPQEALRTALAISASGASQSSPRGGSAGGTGNIGSGSARPILVTGSFYMVAEIRPLLKSTEDA